MATRSWNRVELIGNLTRDPEIRYTPQGSAVATFSIATNRVFVSDGEKREEADFHRVVAWNKLAELCSQLLKKGNRVFVSGRLQNRSWQDQEGQQKQITEIVLEDMILLTNKNENGGSYEDVSYDEPTGSTPEKAPKEVEEAIEKESPKKSSKKEDSGADAPVVREPVKEEVADEELDDLPF
jgi:single-strand DNA-binding protein